MTESLIVILGDERVGEVHRLQGGRLRFEYDDGYRAKATATPLSVSMPLQTPSYGDGQIRPWLWGLLPDNDAVLARWARQFQVSASSPFSLLGTPVGRDCAGAVRFAQPEEEEAALSRPGRVTWLTDAEVAQRLRDLREDSTSWLGPGFSGQFSLGGAQTKTALQRSGDRWGAPAGAEPTTHILKPAIEGFEEHDLNEHLCMDAARRAGLPAAQTEVHRFEDESAVVVRRYDRQPSGSAIWRQHQEDVCQALSLPPARKYQNEGGPGVREVTALLRKVMPPDAADQAIRSFADALIWNWLIAGTDAHAKNYSLLIGGNDVRLAPLYDISSALPYDTHERKLRFAMKYGGEYTVLARNVWPRTARDLDIPPAELLDRVRTLALRAPDAFADAAKTENVTRLASGLPSRLADLVADRCSECLAVVS